MNRRGFLGALAAGVAGLAVGGGWTRQKPPVNGLRDLIDNGTHRTTIHAVSRVTYAKLTEADMLFAQQRINAMRSQALDARWRSRSW